MAANPQTPITPEQYLEMDRAAQIRSEFYQGRMYAMSGGTYAHGQMIANVCGGVS
jgi:hypothetical protein